MFHKILRTIQSALLPLEKSNEEIGLQASITNVVAPRQRILNKLKEHFLIELHNETTTESLLFHTSYTVYIRAEEYERLAPSFAQTVRDAVNVFIKELRKMVARYPNYQNHSKFWEMQLVAIPKDADINGLDMSQFDEESIIVKSKLFADNAYDSRMVDDEHYVVTIHTKNSSSSMPPTAFNLAALKGLTELAKDKYRIEFSLEDIIQDIPKSEATRFVTSNKLEYYAILHIVDGEFTRYDGTSYHVYKMTSNRLLMSGKHGHQYIQNQEVITINDENLMNPTLEIVRDAKSGQFTITAIGEDIAISGRYIQKNIATPLYNNSQIMINGDYQIDFKIK